jgi:hypothetical protein
MAVLCLGLAPSWLWGADTKAHLDQARASYQQTIAQYGKNSPQAKTAKSNLRNARHAFHADRRQRQNKQTGSH